jgi:hypothetical protein
MNLQMEGMAKAEPHEKYLMVGEAVMYGMVFLWMVSVVFILVIFANAIARNENKFYLWLGVLVIVQIVMISLVTR